MFPRHLSSHEKRLSRLKPIHTYNSGQPYSNARGREAKLPIVERHRFGPHPIIRGRPTCGEFVAAVCREMKIRFYSRRSISNYASAIRGLLGWFGRPPHLVTTETVRQYLELLVDGGASSSHLSVVLSAIRTAFDKFCGRDVTLGLATPRRKKSQPVILSSKEVLRIIEAAPRAPMKLAISIMYSAGLRNSELCRLRFRDIDFERGTIRVVQGKGNADRIVMLPKSIANLLRVNQEWGEFDGYLFPSLDSSRKGKHMSPRTLQRWVRSCVAIAGVNKRVTPHSFRHAFATHLLEHGTDIRYIQKLLGHKRLETTTIYARVATFRTSRVVSPLDTLQQENRADDSLPPVSSESASPLTRCAANNDLQESEGIHAGRDRSRDRPVGRMNLELIPDEDGVSATVCLSILRPNGSPVILEGTRVTRCRKHWLQIELPMVEQWDVELAKLPRVQRDRIESAGFFENLRSHICRRFNQLFPKQEPG